MKVELPRTSPLWKKLRRAQSARTRESTEAIDGLPALPESDAARRFWSRRTWSELAAVPAVSQAVLALVREGAGLGTIGAYTTIAQDEVRHAELSQALAESLGGYDDEVPDGIEYAPRSLATPADVPVVVWAVANGCFSETVSLALIRARHGATKHPTVRLVLNETLKDEALHVRIGWQIAGELVPKLTQAQRNSLAEYGRDLTQMIGCTFGTAGLPAKVRRREDALRDETAKASLGALPAAKENAVIAKTLDEIHARLAKLGVRTQR
jgi:hypothetical protein